MAAAKRSKGGAASYVGLRPSSARASRVASSSSRKEGTACEVALCRALSAVGLRFATNVSSLPGCPDLVFEREKVAVFVDGDFWHGRNLAARIVKLSKGHNSTYWIRKIRSNAARDRRVRRQLRALGWRVFRFWEGDITADANRAAARIVRVVAASRVAAAR